MHSRYLLALPEYHTGLHTVSELIISGGNMCFGIFKRLTVITGTMMALVTAYIGIASSFNFTSSDLQTVFVLCAFFGACFFWSMLIWYIGTRLTETGKGDDIDS